MSQAHPWFRYSSDASRVMAPATPPRLPLCLRFTNSQFVITEAVMCMVIDQPGSLQMRIDRDGAEESESMCPQILAYDVG